MDAVFAFCGGEGSSKKNSFYVSGGSSGARDTGKRLYICTFGGERN